MSKRLDVPLALLALAAGLAGQVLGPLDDNVAEAVPAGGRILIGTGDPGDPQIDLSPLGYNYDHQIPVDFVFPPAPGLKAEQALDAALTAFSAAIVANRTLGGLVTWLETGAPPTDDVITSATTPLRGARMLVTASYSTPNPL